MEKRLILAPNQIECLSEKIMPPFIPIEFQKSFDKTRQTAIAIHAEFSPSGSRLSSQFGGYPYWQADVEPPMDSDNTPMALLAQINFAEVPAHPDLPEKGILQFFIPKQDEVYGADFDNVGAGRLVTQFWQAPDERLLVDWRENLSEDDLLPIHGRHQLTFEEKQEIAGIETIECAEAMQANPFEVLEDVSLNEKEESLFYDAITETVAAQGHKLLGYPDFTQAEPRETTEYRLLLQIDTDMTEDNDIMWGDSGVGHLFIREQDLKAQHFDKVWFYWDCA